MNQEWFEMPDKRRDTFSKSIWIPLRTIHVIEEIGEIGKLGYKSEFFGVGTLAVPLENKTKVKKLGWNEIGTLGHHSGYCQDKKYITALTYCYENNIPLGEHLVLEQSFGSIENKVWHLNQDLVLTLGLIFEDNAWVRPVEGYLDIARIKLKNGSPYLIEIRASHLQDYLCARKMSLYMTSYRSREEIVDDTSHISWQENCVFENNKTQRWEGRITEIHEGGTPFGSQTAVFHVARTDINLEDDVPELNPVTEENTKSQSWIIKEERQKIYSIQGELWKNEWLEPASSSPIVRRDISPSTNFFITTINGEQVNKETLINSDSWLWFRPEIINFLLSYRNSKLIWYSQDTCGINCCGDSTVHFGINASGLINVYAKDIGLLPDWQQKIWVGYNISPNGKVSEELLDSQMRAQPAHTVAPERLLVHALEKINEISYIELKFHLLKPHHEITNLLSKIHRFRVTNKDELCSLAKDIIRLTAERIDSNNIKNLIITSKDEKLGSLKCLQSLVSLNTDIKRAEIVMSPLFGAYDLRLLDSHLPSNKEYEKVLNLVQVDASLPFIFQGYQLIQAVASCICNIADTIKGIHKSFY